MDTLEKTTEILSKLTAKSSPDDIAPLLEQGSVLSQVHEAVNQRLEYLTDLQQNLVDARLTINKDDKLKSQDIDKATAEIKIEIDQVRGFNKAFGNLSNLKEQPKQSNALLNYIDNTIKTLTKLDTSNSKIATFAKNTVLKTFGFIKNTLLGKSPDIKSVTNDLKANLDKIKENTKEFQGKHEGIAKEAAKFIGTKFKGRVKERQEAAKKSWLDKEIERRSSKKGSGRSK